MQPTAEFGIFVHPFSQQKAMCMCVFYSKYRIYNENDLHQRKNHPIVSHGCLVGIMFVVTLVVVSVMFVLDVPFLDPISLPVEVCDPP